MCNGVKTGHSRRPERQRADSGQAQVDKKQRLGGFRDARCQLAVFGRPRNLGAVQLHAADAEHGQYRHGDHDDPDAAQPLQQLAVDENGAWQHIQAGNHRRTGRGQPGDRFENRIHGAQLQPRSQHEGQRAGQAQHCPEQRRDEKTVADAQLMAHMLYRQPAQQACGEGQRQRAGKAGDSVVVIQQGHAHGDQQGAAEQHQQQAQNAQRYAQVHATGLGKEAETDREQLLHGGDAAAIGEEQHDVVIRFHKHVPVGNQHFVAAHNGANGHALRQIDLFQAAPDDPGGIGVATCRDFNRLRRAATQGMHIGNVAAAHMGQQAANGDLLR